MPLQPIGHFDGRHLYTWGDGVCRANIARWNADGSLDIDIYPRIGANQWVGSIFRQSSGKLLVVGDLIKFNNLPRQGLNRLNDDAR